MKRIIFLLVVLTVAIPAFPQSSRTSSRQCAFNGDCQDPLVCEGGFCRAQCASDRDCYAGWVCLRPTLSGPLPPNGVPPNQSSNRCAPPGTPSNPVMWNAQRNGYDPLPLPIVVGLTVPVAAAAQAQSVPDAPTVGYAIPQGTGSPHAGTKPPIGLVNPGMNLRRVHRTGGMEFQRGENDEYLYMRMDGGQWNPVGAGLITSEPAAITIGDVRTYVFAKGRDNAIWGVFCVTGKCDDWFSLGGVLTSAPTVTIQTDGSLRVRATGSDGRPWFIVGDGTNWSAWNPE